MQRIVSAVLFLVATLGASTLGVAQDGEWRHASSLIGEPKYPADFERFDYVNPDAPKGGVVRELAGLWAVSFGVVVHEDLFSFVGSFYG